MKDNPFNSAIKTDLAPCIAVFGTGSDVGKSVITTALCRIFVTRGVRVAPFKAQNMSNNSGVTPEGLEMGRAQIVQAEAARIPPHVDMNPILLKPTSEIGAQVVCLGKAIATRTAREYHLLKETLFATAAEALDRLRRTYDLIFMEGAGSCAEVNLMPHDIVNFRMAETADAAVVLVGDIHRGGIFAQMVGTLECLSKHLQDRIAGFVINRFRGDIQLFQGGVEWIEQKTGKKVFGVLPWYEHFTIEAEDSVVIENPSTVSVGSVKGPAIAVIRIPHISNFTDFDPLSSIDGMRLCFVEKAQDLSMFSAVILPGSKSTRFDLDWLKQTGWAEKLTVYAQNNGYILGICGGYQMLGTVVHDTDGLEGTPGSTEGLSLLPVQTFLKAPKTTTLTRFSWNGIQGSGYEIHMGQTDRLSGEPLFQVHARNSEPCVDLDGCSARNNRIIGTYIHGLFDTPGITRCWLEIIGVRNLPLPQIAGPAARDGDYELLAAHVERHIDLDAIIRHIGLKGDP
jgi:adenosylcobyric acid synthase